MSSYLLGQLRPQMFQLAMLSIGDLKMPNSLYLSYLTPEMDFDVVCDGP